MTRNEITIAIGNVDRKLSKHRASAPEPSRFVSCCRRRESGICSSFCSAILRMPRMLSAVATPIVKIKLNAMIRPNKTSETFPRLKDAVGGGGGGLVRHMAGQLGVGQADSIVVAALSAVVPSPRRMA